MKQIIFIFTIMFGSFSFADERVFDCSAVKLKHIELAPEELLLSETPNLLFRDRLNWSLKIGNLELSTLDSSGPALIKKSKVLKSGQVRYDFWIDGSYEYQLDIDPLTWQATLFWWGLGESVELGQFQCEVIEQ